MTVKPYELVMHAYLDDQLLEDYQTHRDFIDEAQRLKTQRLERAAARAMNTGAK